MVRRHAITLEEGGETLLTGAVGGQTVLHGLLRRVRDLGLPFESVALGFVTARVVECAFIAVGILSVLAVVTLRQGAAGADAGSLVAVGEALVAIKDWTFLLGPGFVVDIGNGLLLGYLIYVPIRPGSKACGRTVARRRSSPLCL